MKYVIVIVVCRQWPVTYYKCCIYHYILPEGCIINNFLENVHF